MKLYSHIGIALIALPLAALAVGPGTGEYGRETVAAAPQAEPDAPMAEPEMAWVDPVITGPVSPQYKRLREAAGCDTAKWPHIPAVCYPD